MKLERRFKESPTMALIKLKSLRYIIADIKVRWDPEDYI